MPNLSDLNKGHRDIIRDELNEYEFVTSSDIVDEIDFNLEESIVDRIDNIENDLNKAENTKYTTENGIKEFNCKNGYVDNIVIEGETLVNLVDYSTLNVEGSNCRTFRLKANTVYTLFNFLDDEEGCTCILNEDLTALINWTSDKVYTFLNPIDQKVIPHYNLSGFKMVILEGDYTDKPISYFEGLKSVGQGDKIEVLSYTNNHNVLTKDLFEIGTANGDISGTYQDKKTENQTRIRLKNTIGVEKNTNYTIFIDSNNYDIALYLFKDNILKFHRTFTGTNILNLNSGKYNSIAFVIRHNNNITFNSVDDVLNKCNIIFDKSENMVYDKKTIPHTLRSLPNGIKDTIEKIGGKYCLVKRCEEITLNGSESYYLTGTNTTNTLVFAVEVDTSNYKNGANSEKPNNILSNILSELHSPDNIYSRDNIEGMSLVGKPRIRILKSRLSSQDSQGFETWLKSNPVTVVYELATPQIIELPNFNPQTYEGDTTLFINSGVVQGECEFEVTNSKGNEIEVLKNKVSNLDEEVYDLQNDICSVNKNLEESKEIKFVHSIGIDKNSIHIQYNASPNTTFNINDIIKDYNSNYFYMFVKPSDGNPVYKLNKCIRESSEYDRGYYLFEIKKGDDGIYRIYDNVAIGDLYSFKINTITSGSETFTLGSSSYIKILEVMLVPAYVGKAYIAEEENRVLREQLSQMQAAMASLINTDSEEE